MAQVNNSSRPVVFIGLGVVALAAGLYLQFSTSSVPAADQQRCETFIQEKYKDSAEAKATLLPKCSEPGMVAMMDAEANGSGASAAAQSIASANQSDMGFNALSFGLIGVGIGLLIGGISTQLRSRKSA